MASSKIKIPKLLAFAVLFFLAGVTAIAEDAGTPPGVASNPMDASAPPAVGNINGIKVSIPNHYLIMPALRYVGESQIMVQPRTMIPTFESPLRKFVIRLRLSTLKPLETLGDLYDLKNTQTRFGPTGKLVSSYYDTWTDISISPERYLAGDGLNKVKEEWILKEGKHGPFVQQNKSIAGLVHEDSVQPAKGDLSHYEYFYDEVNHNTFIVCQSGHSSLNDMTYDDCTHWFIVPELKAVAEAAYIKKALPRWHEIEEATKKLVHSFVVQ